MTQLCLWEQMQLRQLPIQKLGLESLHLQSCLVRAEGALKERDEDRYRGVHDYTHLEVAAPPSSPQLDDRCVLRERHSESADQEELAA